MTHEKINRLNIRVYGLLFNSDGDILLSRERIGSFSFTKFPGGGMEFGEGTRECLIREFKEEVNIDIEVWEHFYTTDFFQQSAFRETDQLISIYYKVISPSGTDAIRLDEFTIENDGRMEQQQFVWVPLQELTSNHVTFPIDKVVVEKLQRS
jgi:ADP-ribose pyrophosphatase YjhB (NUDIX family)